MAHYKPLSIVSRAHRYFVRLFANKRDSAEIASYARNLHNTVSREYTHNNTINNVELMHSAWKREMVHTYVAPP